MATISDALRELKGRKFRLVYELGGPYDRPDGTSGGIRNTKSWDGILEEVFDDHWIRIGDDFVNINHGIAIYLD